MWHWEGIGRPYLIYNGSMTVEEGWNMKPECHVRETYAQEGPDLMQCLEELLRTGKEEPPCPFQR